MLRWTAALLAVGIAGAGARAWANDDQGARDNTVVREWIERARADIEAAAIANAVKVPPVPIKVTWKPKRLAAIDVGAPVLTMVAGDLDGDRKAELYAVTETEVVAFDVGAKTVTERARAPLPADPPARRPRDPVATALIVAGTPPELDVMASTRALGARYVLSGKALHQVGTLDAFPGCPGRSLALVPGRNHFGTRDAPIYAVRCRDDLVDATGGRLSVVAELGAGGALAITVTPMQGGATPAASIEVPDIGYAFDVADLDHDGAVELIASGGGAAGDDDVIKVLGITGTAWTRRPKQRKGYHGGVVAIAAADVDGDGADEVIGAVRFKNTDKVELWRLVP